jgi:antirestriction protein ArdC
MGAACILHELGIETDSSFRNSAAYIQNWLHALKDDPRMIISAAGRAEKAVKLILNVREDAGETADNAQAA